MRPNARRGVGRPRAIGTGGAVDEDPRHQILVAAAKLFSEQSYEGTQLTQIAAEAGLRTPSLYYYFSGKDEIWRALSSYAVDESAAFATDMVSSGGRAAVCLYRLLHAHITRLTSGPYDLWFLIEITGKKFYLLEERASYTAWRESILALIERGIAQGDFLPARPDVALYSIVGCVHGAMALRHLATPSQADEIVDFVIRGLATNTKKAKEICARALSAI